MSVPTKIFFTKGSAATASSLLVRARAAGRRDPEVQPRPGVEHLSAEVQDREKEEGLKLLAPARSSSWS